MTTELIGFSILGRLHIGPVMVLGYLFLDLSLGVVLSYISSPSKSFIDPMYAVVIKRDS